MVEDMYVCFNYNQVKFVEIMIFLKLIKPTKAGRIRHPITGNIEIIYQKYTANMFVNSISQRIFKWLMNEVGQERFQRMIDCGAMKPATISKEEIEAMGDICLMI